MPIVEDGFDRAADPIVIVGMAIEARAASTPLRNIGSCRRTATTFDPEFFGISPREAVAMDPQQRVALRLCWRALENSGINPDDMAGHDMGCYVGVVGR